MMAVGVARCVARVARAGGGRRSVHIAREVGNAKRRQHLVAPSAVQRMEHILGGCQGSVELERALSLDDDEWKL